MNAPPPGRSSRRSRGQGRASYRPERGRRSFRLPRGRARRSGNPWFPRPNRRERTSGRKLRAFRACVRRVRHNLADFADNRCGSSGISCRFRPLGRPWRFRSGGRRASLRGALRGAASWLTFAPGTSSIPPRNPRPARASRAELRDAAASTRHCAMVGSATFFRTFRSVPKGGEGIPEMFRADAVERLVRGAAGKRPSRADRPRAERRKDAAVRVSAPDRLELELGYGLAVAPLRSSCTAPCRNWTIEDIASAAGRL